MRLRTATTFTHVNFNKAAKIVVAGLALTGFLIGCGGGGGSSTTSGVSGGGGSTTPQMGGSRQGTALNLSTVVSTLAGATTGGTTDATGAAARFSNPVGITTDGTNLYVVDQNNYTIRKTVISTGVVTTLAGTAGSNGSTDGTGTAARFNGAFGVTTDGTNLFVLDRNNDTIRKVVISTGVVTTLAGTVGVAGSTDATGTAATFSGPFGITTDGVNLYVADTGNKTIRKVVISTGVVTTIAGTAGASGSTDATGTAARFSSPLGITTDGTNLYITDSGNNTIRKMVIGTGVVTTLAGTAGASGTTDGTGAAARFNAPQGLTSDGTSLYVTDTSNQTIRKVVISTGVVTTVAGTAGTAGFANATGTAAIFRFPNDVTTDGVSLYVADGVNNMIRQIQ